MSIRFVGRIGAQLDATAGGTTTVTTTTAVPVGEFIVLATRAGGGIVASSITDSGSNVWTKLANSDALQSTVSIWYCTITNSLASSSTITVTYSAATSGNRNVAVWAFDGVTRPTTTHTTARAANPATTVSPANITPEQYGSLLFTAVGTSQTSAHTVSSGWTALTIGTSPAFMGAAYTIRNSMDSLATTWTLATAGAMGAVSATITPDSGDFFSIF
jgi:hypothetical protein